MKDEIYIGQAMDRQVRVHAIRSTNLVQKARMAHQLAPTSLAALGRTLSITALMASDLKNENEHVQIRINGKGPIGLILCEADGKGNVRGFCQGKDVYLVKPNGHLDVGKGVGTNGTLSVKRDMGLKEPFVGTVPLQSGEIGEDFAYYYAASQQIPSIVSVGVLVGRDLSVVVSGGMIVEVMPNAQEETITYLEQLAKTLKPMTEYMQEEKPVEEIMKELFSDCQKLESKEVRWHCDCDKRYFENALASLRKTDLETIIKEDGKAEIVCSYCNQKYLFSKEELEQLLHRRQHAANR